LLVTRAVCDDEATLGSREVSVGDVDSDALLALGGETVDQQSEVDLVALRPDGPGVGAERRHLIIEHLPGVEQQTPDEGRLAVVDAAARDEAEEVAQK
jgi:hypothetical protein